MSAPSALAQVDALIAQVQQLNCSDAKPAAAAASGSGASRLPTDTKDNTWWPIIPPGHTAYTWYGVTDAKPSGVISAEAAAASASASAPAAKAKAPPAADSASAPAPKQEKPKSDKAPKESKKPAAAAAPAKAKAAEATLQPDQPLFTALDIRVGQIVSAARHPKPEVTSLYVRTTWRPHERGTTDAAATARSLPSITHCRCLSVCLAFFACRLSRSTLERASLVRSSPDSSR